MLAKYKHFHVASKDICIDIKQVKLTCTFGHFCTWGDPLALFITHINLLTPVVPSHTRDLWHCLICGESGWDLAILYARQCSTLNFWNHSLVYVVTWDMLYEQIFGLIQVNLSYLLFIFYAYSRSLTFLWKLVFIQLLDLSV